MDKDGVYLGDESCVFWQGVERIEDLVCCGGRNTRIAFSKCQRLGIVRSAHGCNSACGSRPERQVCDPVVPSPPERKASIPARKRETPKVGNSPFRVSASYVVNGVRYEVGSHA